MPPLLVRLNLPGFNPPEPFRISDAAPSLTGITRAVLEQIGGFSVEELAAVCSSPLGGSLSLLGELCAGQLVKLTSDAELEVFLASADSPRGPPTIEVRMTDAASEKQEPCPDEEPQQRSLRGEGDNCVGSPATSTDADGRLMDEVSTSTTATSQVAFAPPPSTLTKTQAPSPTEPKGLAHMSTTQFRDARSEAAMAEQQEEEHEQQRSRSTARTTLSTAARSTAPAAGRAALRGATSFSKDGGVAATNASTGTTVLNKPPRPGHALHGVHVAAASGRGRSGDDTDAPREPPSPAPSSSCGEPSTQMMNSVLESEASLVLSQTPRVPGTGMATAARSRAVKACDARPADRVPIHERLFQENAERKRRLDEACLRRQQLEQDALRDAAERALGRSCSPGPRARSRGREPVSSPGVSTPASECSQRRGPPSVGAIGIGRSRSSGAIVGRSPKPASSRLVVPARPASPSASSRGAGDTSSIISERRQVSPRSVVGGAAPASTSGRRPVSPLRSVVGGGAPARPPVGGDEHIIAEERQRMQEKFDTQQQRIDFLEQQHHQALRQLRKAREETALAQRQRFEESDRALGLEELVSEMQGFCGGSAQLQSQFGDWLRRSREALEAQ